MYRNKGSVIVTLWICIIYLKLLLVEADKVLVVDTLYYIFFPWEGTENLYGSFYQLKKSAHLLKNRCWQDLTSELYCRA